jgi:hypothetical protein
MGNFLESEKQAQTKFKTNSPYFSEVARLAGPYRDIPRSFCLPLDVAEQNLFPDIRESALSHFAVNKIKWHNGQNGKPSNHLCSSQVCCVNFLSPFSHQPAALAKVFRQVYADIDYMLPIESDCYVSFEWIGQENYLKEKISRNGQRSRGALFTSADAIIAFDRQDKRRQVVLIEWKYTESYGGAFLKYADSGTDRTEIYKHLLDDPDCPIKKEILPSFDALFYEPFYQFMRQQFLANKMEKAHEFGADIVSVLHIAPKQNADFRKVTSPELEKIGDSPVSIWKKLVKDEGRFISVSTETLFGSLQETQFPEMKSWLEYIHARYPWICG